MKEFIEMYLKPNFDKKFMEILKISKQELERGLELHRKSIVFDALGGDPDPWTEKMVQKTKELIAAGVIGEKLELEMETMRAYEIVNDPEARKEYVDAWNKSGVTCQVSSINNLPYSLDGTLQRISAATCKYQNLSDILVPATCVEGIKRAKREGKHSVMAHLNDTTALEGGFDLDRELDNIDFYYRLGVRIVQLTYNRRNLVGDGCLERTQSGLSDFGVKVIERMNKVGIIVDTSHACPQATMDACEFSKDPVVATHTSCRSLYNHPRNKTDEELKAIAEKDGVMGVHMTTAFLTGETDITEKGTIKLVLDHIDYAVNLIGVEHVGIGSDMSYWPRPQSYYEATQISEFRGKLAERAWWLGWRPEHRYPRHDFTMWSEYFWTNWPYYTVGLVSRGYSDQEVQKIIGGNFMRVVQKVVG